MELDSEVVVLNDGRKIKVVELTGLDEIIAAKITGSEMDNGSGLVQYQGVLHALAIKEIDGEPVKRPTNMTEVRVLLAKFRMKDTTRIAKTFKKLNEDIVKKEKAEGEISAAEQKH